MIIKVSAKHQYLPGQGMVIPCGEFEGQRPSCAQHQSDQLRVFPHRQQVIAPLAKTLEGLASPSPGDNFKGLI